MVMVGDGDQPCVVCSESELTRVMSRQKGGEIEYMKGDLFSTSPASCILAHSCNCQGRWGSGVAAGFKVYFPEAYEIYHRHCKQYKTEKEQRAHLLGKALLIETKRGSELEDNDQSSVVYIACLFTSCGYGRTVDQPRMIVAATASAIADLESQLRDKDIDLPIHIPRINAGLFHVPWEQTAEVLQESDYNIVVHDL